MIKSLILSIITFVLMNATLEAQDPFLISYEKANSITADSLSRLMKANKVPRMIVPVSHGVDIYDVTYKTCWHDSVCIKASGLVFIPMDYDKTSPLVSFHHGTQIKKKRHAKVTGLRAVSVALATDGYVVTMPDYVGLGHGERTHLYQHAETEGLAAIDLLRATNEMCQELGVKINNDLYISGYSQGGHGAMATHKLIQERFADEFNVVASSPMSGPYDLSGVQAEVMFAEYSHPGYLPYLLISYNEVYHFFPDIWSVFRAPYDSILPPLFDGTHTMGDINDVMPKVPKDVIKQELVQQFENNPNFPLIVKLRENSVMEWAPEAPVQLCYCKADEQVDYRNSTLTAKRMKELGAKNIKLRMSGRKLDHFQCALYASVYTKWYFDSIRRGSKRGKKGPLFKRMILGLSKISLNKKNRKKARINQRENED